MLQEVRLMKGRTLEGFGETFVYTTQIHKFNTSDS